MYDNRSWQVSATWTTFNVSLSNQFLKHCIALICWLATFVFTISNQENGRICYWSTTIVYWNSRDTFRRVYLCWWEDGGPPEPVEIQHHLCAIPLHCHSSSSAVAWKKKTMPCHYGKSSSSWNLRRRVVFLPYFIFFSHRIFMEEPFTVQCCWFRCQEKASNAC